MKKNKEIKEAVEELQLPQNQEDAPVQPLGNQTETPPPTDLVPVENTGDNQELKVTRLPINLPVFTGPLDLLVHLITKKELDIFAISLSDITNDYLESIRKMENKDLDIGGEYLILASTLIRHKARALLPKEEVDMEEEEISDQILEMRRKEYERFRKLADELRTREEVSASIFARQGHSPEGTHEVTEYDEVSIYDLHKLFQRIIEEIGTREPKEIQGEEYSVDEKIYEMEMLLVHNERIILSDYLRTLNSKLEIIVVFLALLELIRLHEVLAKQEEIHGEIFMERGEKYKNPNEPEEDEEDELLVELENEMENKPNLN